MDTILPIRDRILHLCSERNITIISWQLYRPCRRPQSKIFYTARAKTPKILTIKKICDGLDHTDRPFSTPRSLKLWSQKLNRPLSCLRPLMLLPPRRPNVGAEEFVVVLPMLHRWWVAVDQRHPLGQPRVLPERLLQPIHSQHPGLVIIQAQTDLGDVRMIAEELEHGAGRGPPKGEVVAVPPVAPGQLHQRGEGQRVNGLSATASRGHAGSVASKAKLYRLVAALHVDPKVVPRPPQASEPGAARYIFANKNAVLVLAAFIERTGLDALPEQIRVDAPGLADRKAPWWGTGWPPGAEMVSGALALAAQRAAHGSHTGPSTASTKSIPRTLMR